MPRPRVSNDRLQDMFREIRLAQRFHAESIIEGWQNISYLEGRPEIPGRRMGRAHRPGTPPTRVPINIFSPYFKSSIQRLYPRRFRARCEPEDQAYYPGAIQLEALLNRNLQVTGFQKEARFAIANCGVYGWGILGHGFDLPHGGIPERAEAALAEAAMVEDTQEMQQRLGVQVSQVAASMTMQANGVSKSQAETASLRRPRAYHHANIQANRPWTVSIAPEDLLFDWSADVYADQRY
ncbi:MAG: hypothetical protein JSV79_03855, partial [Armatimonadota bacterium]